MPRPTSRHHGRLASYQKDRASFVIGSTIDIEGVGRRPRTVMLKDPAARPAAIVRRRPRAALHPTKGPPGQARAGTSTIRRLTGEYVVSEHRDDGTLVLVPESDVHAGLRANGLRAATPSEADAWFAEHADVMLPRRQRLTMPSPRPMPGHGRVIFDADSGKPTWP